MFDAECEHWNLNFLGSILDDVKKFKIDGVTTPYLYFGTWKSSFAWHTEDMDLYSINYLHYGEPKTWYVIPPEYGKRFEELCSTLFPRKKCSAFLRHKTTLIHPDLIRGHNIPVYKVV